MSFRYLCLVVGATLLSCPASAQDRPKSGALAKALDLPANLIISGSVRTRFEALDGQFRPGFDQRDSIVSIRSTLLAEYQIDPIRLGGEIFDSRVYGAEPGSATGTGEVNTLEVVQAYIAADIANPFGPGSTATVQAGRFTLNLGSRRLVAADDYRNTTNGYTGLRADFEMQDGTTGTFIYTLPQLRLPDDQPAILNNRSAFDRESFDLRLWGGLVSKPNVLGKTMVEISYFRVQEFDAPTRPTRDRNLHTIGTRILRAPAGAKVDFEVEGFYQFGRTASSLAINARHDDVSAYFLHADVGYSFAGAWKARLSAEYDYASGDRPGGGNGRFDTLFGMRRADFSPSGVYAAIGRTNISTPGVRLEIAPSKRFDAFAVYRALWAASATDSFSTTSIRDATGRSGRYAGQQVEGRVRRWLIPAILRAEINAVWLLKRGLLKTAPNAPRTGDTHYISAALTATF